SSNQQDFAGDPCAAAAMIIRQRPGSRPVTTTGESVAESTEPTDRNTAEDMGNEAPKKRRSTRKTTRRATAKAAAPEAGQPTEQPTGQDETKAREDKVRVHVLAKSLGRTSKELVEAAAGLGLKKVAQSTLTPEEARRVVEALTPEQPQPEPAAAEEPR